MFNSCPDGEKSVCINGDDGENREYFHANKTNSACFIRVAFTCWADVLVWYDI